MTERMISNAPASTYYPASVVYEPYLPGPQWQGGGSRRREQVLSRLRQLKALKARIAELPDHCAKLDACDHAPNSTAMKNANAVLDALIGFTVVPEKVVASAEGGVSIVFLRADRRGAVECLNTGEIVAAYVGPDTQPVAWDVTPWTIYFSLHRLSKSIGTAD